MHARLSLLLSLALLVSGCADDFASGIAPDAGTPTAPSKLRHSALLGQATRTASPTFASSSFSSARKGGTGDAYVGLIVSLDPYRVIERYGEMDPYRVFDRYRVFSRYRIFDRYEYEHVFAGGAIWVAEDDVDALLTDMQQDAMVNWVEPDVQMARTPIGSASHSASQSETTPWSVLQIGAGTGSAPDVDLYIADTGVSSPDLNERGGQDFSIEAGGVYDGQDRDGHGTHIAGIAAASANGAGIRGVAQGMSIYDLRVLTGEEGDDDSPVDLASAIAAVEHTTAAKLAAPQRPAILNFSLGTDIGTTAYNALDEAIEAASASGVVVVVAAGNSGTDVSTISPAHAASAITVGAHDQRGVFAAFSNRGAGIDILAPGVDIVSTQALENGHGLAVMSGTSMAAGHVSGAAALFLQANPQATPAQVAQALVASARSNATGVPAGTPNRVLWVGHGGLLDVDLPPFFDYAVYGRQKVEIKDRSSVTATTGNANVFAGELKAGSSGSVVEGFGYYTRSVESSAHRTFRPRINPTGLASVQRAQPLVFDADAASPRALRHRATRTTYGDLELSSRVRLGSAEAPTVWRVTGKLKLKDNAQFAGHGVFLVEDDVEIKELYTSSGSAIAIFSEGQIKADTDDARIAGTLFAMERIEIKGTAQIEGSITSLDEVKLEGDVHLRKVPLATSLARALWGE